MFNNFFYSNPRRQNVREEPADTREQQLAAIRRQQQEAAAERRAHAYAAGSYPAGQPQYNDSGFGASYPYSQGDPRAALAQEDLRRRQLQDHQAQEALRDRRYEDLNVRIEGTFPNKIIDTNFTQQRQPNGTFPGASHPMGQHAYDQYRQMPAPQPAQNPRTSNNARRAPAAASLEEQNLAASKIQQTYRIHRSLLRLANLGRKFDEYRSTFLFPEVIDFQDPSGNIISLDTTSATPVSPVPPSARLGQGPAKLAFTARNKPLHSHNEELNRLLTSLDAIDSYGEQSVRERRKEIVKNVEGHLANIEGVDGGLHGWKGIWRRAHDRAAADYAAPNVSLQQGDVATVQAEPLNRMTPTDAEGLESDDDDDLPMFTPPQSPSLHHAGQNLGVSYSILQVPVISVM